MTPLKKILFPTDLSEISPKIVPYVIEMANRFESEVHLLSVIQSLDQLSLPSVPEKLKIEVQEALLKDTTEQLHQFREKYFKKLPNVQAVVLQGNAVEEILKYVDSERIHLVIMGTHGRIVLERMLIGSVANRIVKQCPAPVLTINPHTIDAIMLPSYSE